MENGRCTKGSEGAGGGGMANVTHVFKMKKKVDSKIVYRSPREILGKIKNGLLKGIFMGSTKRQQNCTQNWPYLPKLIFPFDYTKMQTSTMHFIRPVMTVL